MTSREVRATSSTTWIGLVLVLLIAGSAAAVDRFGRDLLQARNLPSSDARLQAIGRTLERIEKQLAQHRRDGDLFDRDLEGVAGRTPSLPDLDALLREAARIVELLTLRPRLVSPFEPDVERPTLTDLLYSAATYHDCIRDPETGPDERARAFVALSRLPHAEAHFDGDTIRRWRTEVALAPDDYVAGLLFDVFAWIDAPTEVSDVLVEVLVGHGSESIRRAAVVALGKRAADPVVHASLNAARSGDASRLVREEAASVLRKLRYRE